MYSSMSHLVDHCTGQMSACLKNKDGVGFPFLRARSELAAYIFIIKGGLHINSPS